LPDVIRDWTKESLRIGNHILSRIDPLDWAVTDPGGQSISVWTSGSARADEKRSPRGKGSQIPKGSVKRKPMPAFRTDSSK